MTWNAVASLLRVLANSTVLSYMSVIKSERRDGTNAFTTRVLTSRQALELRCVLRVAMWVLLFFCVFLLWLFWRSTDRGSLT